MMYICVVHVSRDDLVAKKRYEKQKLISLESSLSETLETLLQEINGTKLRQEFQKKVICRKCKSFLSSYHKAKVCILGECKTLCGASFREDYITVNRIIVMIILNCIAGFIILNY